MHTVTLTKGFYMQHTEMTQREWKNVIGSPPFIKEYGGDCPVNSLSWEDVQKFIEELNRLDAPNLYRLPTEAEWEYACRAGTETPFHFGKCLNPKDANYDGNFPLIGCEKGESRGRTIAVGTLDPNAWEPLGMVSGLVWQFILYCRPKFRPRSSTKRLV